MRFNHMNNDRTYSNCIVLLMGFAGTGKLTIAKELAKYPNFRLVDNHTCINPIFNLITQEGVTPLSESAWRKAGKICDVIFETMLKLSPSHFSFVITQEMMKNLSIYLLNSCLFSLIVQILPKILSFRKNFFASLIYPPFTNL